MTARLRQALTSLTVGRSPAGRILDLADKEAIYRLVEGAWRACDLGRPRMHDLRRRFATWQAEKGTPVPKIQAWLGHRVVTTTMRYILVDPASVPASARED